MNQTAFTPPAGTPSMARPSCRELPAALTRTDARLAAACSQVSSPAESAKGEDVCARAGVEEHDLERARGDRAGLADELVHARLGQRALPGLVDVEAVGVAGRPTIEPHDKGDWSARVWRREDQVEVARLEAVRD